MPLFDFRCRDCSVTFEFERPFGSKARPACPACRSRKTEKMLTPPAIQFKGKGFYKKKGILKCCKTHSRPHPPTPSPAPPAEAAAKAEGKVGEHKRRNTTKKPEAPCGGDCASCPLPS